MAGEPQGLGTEIKGVRLHAWPVTFFFYVGAEDLNSGPQAHALFFLML